MSWRDTIKPAEPTKGWRSTVAPLSPEPKPVEPPKVVYAPEERKIEALTTGALKGATLDNVDELIAAIRATAAPGKWQELYQQYVQEERARQKGLEEQHPVLFKGAEVAGYTVPTLVGAQVLKPASMLGRAATEAGFGAIQGVGTAEDLEQAPAMAGQGALFGAGASGVVDVLGKAARTGLRKASDVFGEVFLNTPKEVTQALRKDPNYLEDVKTTRELADILAERLSGAKQQVSDLSENALSKLKPEPIKNKQTITQQLESLIDKFGVTGTEQYPSSQTILSEIQMARDAIQNSKSEREIKNLLRRLDERADWQTPSGDAINAVRKEIRTIIDGKLKSQNPEYAAAMEPLAEQTALLGQAAKISRVTRAPEGYAATDSTIQALETFLGTLDKSKRELGRETLEKVYPGLEEQLRKQQLARRAEGGVMAGSRNVLGGTVLGGAVGTETINSILGSPLPPAAGAILGGAIGATSGAFIDKYGRSFGSFLARNQGRASQFINRYGDLFKGAANKEAVHQFLMGVDPEYNAMFEEIQNGKFSSPTKAIDLLGSAVLGPELTNITGAVGAGIGSKMAGGDFETGFMGKINDPENQSIAQSAASTLGALIPTNKLSKPVAGLVRGTQLLDNVLSGNTVKNAPNVMHVKLPSGHEFPSKIQNSEKFAEAISNIKLKNKNYITIERVGNNNVAGYITHPNYPNHTSFNFVLDKDKTWTLNSNYRDNRFAKAQPLKGSSTDLRQAVAKIVGGIGSDPYDRNTTEGLKSYFKDPEAILTRPNLFERDTKEPYSKFYTPGSKEQKDDFVKALKESYGALPSKEDELITLYDRITEKKNKSSESYGKKELIAKIDDLFEDYNPSIRKQSINNALFRQKLERNADQIRKRLPYLRKEIEDYRQKLYKQIEEGVLDDKETLADQLVRLRTMIRDARSLSSLLDRLSKSGDK